jgi:ketosteroid isomerase-like protein
MTTTRRDVALAVFAAYRCGDRAAAEQLVADDFVFTSPQDDHIDRTAWFERCFPTAGRFSSQQVLRTAETGDDVFVMYEYELRESGERYRNAELITVRDGRIVETQVFFGGRG